MQTELIALSLTKQEAMECLRACILSAIVEDETRVQQGFEPMDFSTLVQRLAGLLRIGDNQMENVTNELAEDLWSYAWYVYTNEWAWFRAEQQATEELGMQKGDKSPELRKKAEKLYKKNFETYVSQIDMKPKLEKTQDSGMRRAGLKGRLK